MTVIYIFSICFYIKLPVDPTAFFFLQCSKNSYTIEYTECKGTESKCLYSHDLPVNRIIRFICICRVGLCHFDNFLCIVQKEQSKQYQSTIYTYRVKTCTQGCSRRQEHTTWKMNILKSNWRSELPPLQQKYSSKKVFFFMKNTFIAFLIIYQDIFKSNLTGDKVTFLRAKTF